MGKMADGTEKLNQGDDIKLFFSDETFEKFSGSGTPDSEFEALKVLSREFTSGKRKLPVVYEDKDVIFIISRPACFPRRQNRKIFPQTNIFLHI